MTPITEIATARQTSAVVKELSVSSVEHNVAGGIVTAYGAAWPVSQGGRGDGNDWSKLTLYVGNDDLPQFHPGTRLFVTVEAVEEPF